MRLVHRVCRRGPAAGTAALALAAVMLVPGHLGAASSGAAAGPPSDAAAVPGGAPPVASPADTPQVASTAPPSAPEAAPASASLTVDDIRPVELRPDGPITITGSLMTGQASTDVSLVISRTVRRTSTRSEIDEWLVPPPQEPAQRLDVITSIALDPVAAGESRLFTAVLDAASVGLRNTIAAAGPYGLVLDLVAAPAVPPEAPPGTPTSVAVARGFLVWSPDIGIAPLQLGLVASLPSFDPDPLTGLIDPVLLERETSADGLLTRAAAVVAELPATWSVDPLLLASATAGKAGPSAQDWVRSLAAARGDREVVLDAWGRPDPDLLAASGQDTRLRELLSAVRARPGGDREAVVDPADVLGGPVRTDIEVATPGLRAEGLASIALAGQAVLVAESVLPLVDEGMPFTPDLRENLLTRGGPLPALLTDTDIGETVAAAAAGDALALTTLLAQFSATALQRPSDQRVVGVLLADPAGAKPEAAAALGAALASSAYVVPISVESWLATPPAGLTRNLPPPRDPAAGPTPAEVAAAVEGLLARRQLIGDLGGSVLGTGPSSDELDLAAGSAVATSLQAITQVSDGFASDTTAWQQGVRLIPGSSITLAASLAEIRRTIVNETADDVRLRVDVVSRSPRLRIPEGAGEVTIPAGEQIVVAIPVEAVSNGRAQLILQLVTPGGTAWGPPTELEVRVATGAETGALAVTAALITIVFVLGTVRTIRRSRRRSEPARIET